MPIRKANGKDISIAAFDTLLDNTSDNVYIVDSDMVFRRVSDSCAKMMGFDNSQKIEGRPVRNIIENMEMLERHISDDKKILESGKSMLDFMETIVDKKGNTHYLLCSKYPVCDDKGRPHAVLCISRDVSREYEIRDDYIHEIQYLMKLKDESYGVWLIDATAWRIVDYRLPKESRRIVRQCETIEEYMAAATENIQGNEDALKFLNAFSLKALQKLYKSGRRVRDFEYKRVIDDTVSWVHLSVKLIQDPINGHMMSVISLNDINNEKNRQSELVKAAEIDAMTGILNHDATLSYMEKYLTEEGAEGIHALFMVDRDHLKAINDTLGHQAGDDAIMETARVVRSVFRDTDIVGRVGGDEFLILMKNIGKIQTARRKGVELVQSLQCIVGAAENPMSLTGSVGIALYQGDSKSFDRLYAEADAALYKAKAEGRNRFVFFDSDIECQKAGDVADTFIDTINLRTLVNSIDGGIVILRSVSDNEPLPVFFSDAFLDMMGGLSQKEAFALYGEDFFACIHSDDREQLQKDFADAVNSGKPLRTTYRLLGKGGEYIWLSSGMNITRNPDGTVDVYAVHTNIEKLASDEQRFRMAFSQTSHMLCELDIAENTVYFYRRDGERQNPESIVKGLPESVIKSGFIQKKSVESFRQFYSDISAGKQNGRGLFLCRYLSNGKYGWTSITYQTVFNNNGVPEKAIGSIEELPNISRAQERLTCENTLLRAVSEDTLATVRVNLTTNVIEYIHTEENSIFTVSEGSKYSDFTDLLMGDISFQEDTMILKLNLQRENLLETYAAGNRWTEVEYRRVDDGNRWTKIVGSLIEEPVSKELILFLYISDIEERRSQEVRIPFTVERDQSMHIYTQGTLEKLIDAVMRAGSADRKFALAIIRIFGLPAISAKIGVENVELEKMYIGRYLCLLLDGASFVGIYGTDGMMIFCPNARSDEWIREKVEGAVMRVNEIKRKSENNKEIRLICGISTENAAEADFNGMLSQATRVCENNSSSGTDKVMTFAEYVKAVKTISPEDKTAIGIVSEEELNRPFFSSEREAMSRCMAAMLSAETYDASIVGALGVLGEYYKAQRVYTLSLFHEGTSVSGLHEWVEVGRHSTLRQMAGASLSKLPVFKRVKIAAKPMVLDRGAEDQSVEHSSKFSFIVLPIILDSKVQGFLCIESPELHKSDVALPYALLSVILHERARFGLGAAGLGIAGRDELTGFANHKTFDADMSVFNPESYHSVGVMQVSIISFGKWDKFDGSIVGDEMLAFAAHTIEDTVRKSKIYRNAGQSFVVVTTNLSKEAFDSQCARCESILSRRYPRCFAVGAAWSDKGISPKRLLAEAETTETRHTKDFSSLIQRTHREMKNLSEVEEGLASGRFSIYLQPRVDMRTGTIVEAEALARYTDIDGNVVLPAEFIRTFESAGAIRELDYFVLDRAFQSLEKRIESGEPVVPISVNFSRQTLLSESVFASVLAIKSRYDVPAKYVMIEMTESLGEYETEAVGEIMEKIHKHGFRFALDDLGTEYSSLHTLGSFPVDEIKMDKSLVTGIVFNSMSRSVVESVVKICSKKKIRCVAEGVESEMQADALLEAGCTFAQGYFYGKPMPEEKFYKKLKKSE